MSMGLTEPAYTLEGTDAVMAVSVLAVGALAAVVPWCTGLLPSRSRRAAPNSDDGGSGPGAHSRFFLGGQSSSWVFTALAATAVLTGPDIVQGLSQEGINHGLPALLPSLAFVAGCLVTMHLLLPVFLRNGMVMAPEYVDGRFGSRPLRVYLTAVLLFVTAAARAVVLLFFTSKFVAHAAGWPAPPVLLVLVFASGVIPLLGGFRAVFRAAGVYVAVALFVAAVLIPLEFHGVGGWALIQQAAKHSSEAVNAGLQSWMLHLFRSTGSYEWASSLAAGALLAVWLTCLDPAMAQVVMAARNRRESRSALVLTAAAVLVPVIGFGMPGVIGRLVFFKTLACSPAGPCLNIHNTMGTAVFKFLPHGLIGVALGAGAATLVSTLSSLMLATSSMCVWLFFMRVGFVLKCFFVCVLLLLLLFCFTCALWFVLRGSKQLLHTSVPPVRAVCVGVHHCGCRPADHRRHDCRVFAGGGGRRG